MRVEIGKINGGTQQFADTINNSAPVAVEVHRVRELLTRCNESGQLPADVAEKLDGEISEAEQEAAADEPRRGRLKEIFANIAVLTSGITAASDLTESVSSALHAVSTLE